MRVGERGDWKTERLAAFAELYVTGEAPIRFNATRAAEAAGFACPTSRGRGC